MTKILVIDNYDSFVFTLVGYIQQLGAQTTVVRNDEVNLEEAKKLAQQHDGVLISPGPGAQLAADRTCFPSSSSDAPGPWAKAVYTEWPRRAQEAVIVGRIARRAGADV